MPYTGRGVLRKVASLLGFSELVAANSWSGSRKSPWELVVQTAVTWRRHQDALNETGPSFGDAVGWPQRLAENVDVARFWGTERSHATRGAVPGKVRANWLCGLLTRAGDK